MSAEDQGQLPPLAERRPQRRRRVLLPGILTYGDGSISYVCTIRNVSDQGARIQLEKEALFPTEVLLIHVNERVAYRGKVIWNGGGDVGLTFFSKLSLATLSDPTLAFLNRLWLQSPSCPFRR